MVLKLKTFWRDGTTHLVMSPLEFMQRLAAPEPRPRPHLIRFHGALAPNAKLRAQVVLQVPELPTQAAQPLSARRTDEPIRLRSRWQRGPHAGTGGAQAQVTCRTGVPRVISPLTTWALC